MCCKDKVLNKFRKYFNGGNYNKIIRELSKEHKKSPYTVDNQTQNKSKVCFILSCPGREEMIANALCQGSTGDNLNILLEILHNKMPCLFLSKNKNGYDILNATTVVHFKALDNKTEGTKEEIAEDSKLIVKYCDQNRDLQFAILLGNKSASLKNIFGGKTIVSRHLGFQSVNQIDKDIYDKEIDEVNYPNSEERNKARINVIAKEILEQIDKSDKK